MITILIYVLVEKLFESFMMVSRFRSMLYKRKAKFGISSNIAEHFFGACNASYLLLAVSLTVVKHLFLFNRSCFFAVQLKF